MQNAHLDGLALTQHILDHLRPTHLDLGGMDQALDTRIQTGERTVRHDAGDGGGHDRAHGEGGLGIGPRVGMQTLEAERHAAALGSQVEHLDLDLLIELDDLAGVNDTAPR